MKIKNNEKYIILLCLLVIGIIIAFGLLCSTYFKKYEVILIKDEPIKILSEDWILRNNATNKSELVDFPVRFDHPKEKYYTFSKILDNDFTNIKVDKFYFATNHMNIKVFLNDELIYSHGNDMINKLGKTIGNVNHMIDLPKDFYNKELTIQVGFLIEDGIRYIADSPIFGTSSSIFRYLTDGEMMKLFLSSWILLLGAFSIITYLCLFKHISDVVLYNLFFIGFFGIFAGIYFMCRTVMISYIISNTYLLHVLEFLSLSLIPIPIVMMVGLNSNKKGKNCCIVVTHLLLLNSLIQFILNILSIYDYRESVTITHILIVITILLCILLVIRNYKNKPKIFTISFLPILVAVVIELMLFYSKLLVSIGTASSVGVLIFICMQMYAFTSSYLYIYKESLLAQKHKKMAYTDSLTELPNRTAFDEQVNFYKKNIKTYNCIWCISIDINDLKYVNDNFGHSQGDKLIRETATIIYDCFSSIGRVYRIGGDEFNILLENHSENIIKNHIKMIFNSLDEYNRINELQLGIALGYDKITVALSEDIDRLIKKADGLMYENKRNSKSLNSKVELDKISNDSIC